MAEGGGQQGNIAHLEGLLFKATNPTNKIEDVNTIKQFCDAVSVAPEGSIIACRLLAHKIQSPQEREAVQALAVLEACVKGCGESFHAEVGKFKFLNEMIKLVSPRYLGSRTPEHIKKKVIEMLYIWTKELKSESKVTEAYEMLKKQGIVKEDPAYVGGAVFAASLPPRQDTPLSEDQNKLLKRLLQSKNPDDLQQANKIIKGMVKEDERKMDVLTRRSTELVMVNNNSKLLNEMLDHYDKGSSGAEELELFKELYDSCVKMQPKLFRLAADTEENDETITEILQASDDLSRVIDRYKMVIEQGKPDITRPLRHQASEELLDINQGLGDISLSSASAAPTAIAPKPSLLSDDDILGLGSDMKSTTVETPQQATVFPSLSTPPVATTAPMPALPVSNHPAIVSSQPSIDDLLNGSPTTTGGGSLLIDSLTSTLPNKPTAASDFDQKMGEKKTSRQRGLEELDLLGESAIKSHLSSRSPQFAKRTEKVSLSMMQNQNQTNMAMDLTASLAKNSAAIKDEDRKPPAVEISAPLNGKATSEAESFQESKPEPKLETQNIPTTISAKDVKLADIELSLSDINPGSTPPMNLPDDNGVSIILNFGKDQPREHVTAVVVTIINKTSEPMSDFELKAVVPKGCRVRLQEPSGKVLPAHNPFVPPSAITQIMLIANPQKIPVSFKYVLSYVQDDEPQTEMGQVKELPI